MTTAEATRRAHALWHELGIGIAVHANGVYSVGIAKDADSVEVFGTSTESFEAAFENAEVVDG